MSPLLLSSLLVRDLSLLLLLVLLDALLDICLKLSAFPGRELVKLELEELTSILRYAFSDNIDDPVLLFGCELTDVVLE